MIPLTLKLSKQQQQQQKNLQSALKRAEQNGDYPKLKRIMTILLLGKEQTVNEITDILCVSAQAVRDWFKSYILQGIHGLRSGKSPGRPSKLTKKQRRELARLIDKGPEASGFSGACWRTPMIQYLIKDKFDVFYNVHYLSELLKNMGFSFQKAAFVADKRDEEVRQAWLNETWPEIMELAEKTNAYVLFGDEASFPQWGTLNYTWSRKGKQPIVKTSGNRRSYKVFGLIDYFTGRFFSKGHEGKLNADSYIEFLKGVISKTRKHIILIQDGAPYHKGKKMNAFLESNKNRLTIYTLPSYSPDFNPIEKLWKKIKEKGTHLIYFPTFDSLKSKVNDMLGLFENVKKEVLSLFGFYNALSAE